MRRTIGFFKITDAEIINLYRKYLSLKEDEDKWYEADLTFYKMESSFTINIAEGKAEQIEGYKMRDRDYEYFVNEDIPYIMVRKECDAEICKKEYKKKYKLCSVCKIIGGE